MAKKRDFAGDYNVAGKLAFDCLDIKCHSLLILSYQTFGLKYEFLSYSPEHVL